MTNYDCIVFLNLDYVVNSATSASGRTTGLGVGYRRKVDTKRTLVLSSTQRRGGVAVRTYDMASGGKYIEIDVIDPADLMANIPEFRYLTANSKLIVSGHGAPGISFVQTDRHHQNLPISSIADFIGTNILFNSPEKFSSLAGNKLKVSFFSCSSASPELDFSKSMADSMAGQLLTELRRNEVYAVIKARTTNVLSVKTTGRGTDTITKQRHRYHGKMPDHVQGALPVPSSGIRTHQRPSYRRHGFKRVFSWGLAGTMECRDLADMGSEVDQFFECQKDRVIQYLYGLAYYVADTDPAKILALVDLAVLVESQQNRDQIVGVLRNAIDNSTHAVNRHTALIFRFGNTRSHKVIAWLITELEAARSLAEPSWDEKYLGAA